MLINVPSVTEDGIKNKQELDERCELVHVVGGNKKLGYVDFIYRERITNIYFRLRVKRGGEWVDDTYNFPYTAEDIANNVVERKERLIQVTEVYYE